MHHRCITRAAFDTLQQQAKSGRGRMVEPNHAVLAKNPAYRPATEKALVTGLFLWARFVSIEQFGWSRAEVDAALAGIGETLTQVYELADGVSTAVAAEALAEERLRAA